MVARSYESDLLLCPAAAMRAPVAEIPPDEDDEFGLSETPAKPRLVK